MSLEFKKPVKIYRVTVLQILSGGDECEAFDSYGGVFLHETAAKNKLKELIETEGNGSEKIEVNGLIYKFAIVEETIEGAEE